MPAGQTRNSVILWIGLIVFISIVYPRLVYMGYFPYMDEGYYSWKAMEFYRHIQMGMKLPKQDTLSLYPLLVSWLRAFPLQPMLLFRIADLLIATAAATLFCALIWRESGKCWIGLLFAFIFLCSMNHVQVIDAGFKNSIFAAYIPLFSAMLLCRENQSPCSGRWFSIGALVSLGTLLREPLVVFAFLGFCSIWIGWGFKAAWRYALGGIAVAIAIVLILGSLRGDLGGLLLSYAESGDIYKDQAFRVWGNFLKAGTRGLLYFAIPIICALSGVFVRMAFVKKERAEKGLFFTKRMLFWVFAACIPILEPFLKIGFVYHFSVCLPGLAGMCAYEWRGMEKLSLQLSEKIPAALAILTICQCFISLPKPQFHLGGEFFEKGWTAGDDSYTIYAANLINKNTKPQGSLAVSGFTYYLFGASGKMPPLLDSEGHDDSFLLSDLSRAYRSLGKDRNRLVASLENNPPDFLALAFTYYAHEPAYINELKEAVESSGLYEYLGSISPNINKNYGWLGYHFYKKKN